MAIDSVSSAVSATVQAPPQNREPVRQSTESPETQATQRTETRRAEREETRAAQQAEPQRPPAPVVNTQGQVTGTRINTTA